MNQPKLSGVSSINLHRYIRPILKAILIRRSGEQGFAVPIALALGLIMILLSTISIFKSQGENISAITQRQTAQALSVAEAGVARYRELINKNRNLAIYDKGSWGSLPSSRPICDSSTTISNAVSNVGKNVDSSDPSLGSYKLVSYDYSGADGSNPTATTIGTLTVEGNVNGATASLQVEIPVRPENPADNLQPALWLGNSPTNIGNLTVVNGNIFVKAASDSGCPTPTTPTSANFQNQSTQLIIAEPRPLPAIPSLPGTINTVTSAALNSALSLPRSGDSADANNVYHYKVTDALNLSNLSINPGTKVILYVQGSSITFNGGATTPNAINANTTSPYLEIYGSTNTSTIQFSGSGTININAFIHAPNATVTVSGSPTVNINGAIWVSNWNVSSSNAIQIKPDDTTGSPSYSFYSSKPANESKPTIYSPTLWTTVEAN